MANHGSGLSPRLEHIVWDEGDGLRIFINETGKLGKVPTGTQWDKLRMRAAYKDGRRMPSRQWYRNHFGSWSNLLEVAGMTK